MKKNVIMEWYIAVWCDMTCWYVVWLYDNAVTTYILHVWHVSYQVPMLYRMLNVFDNTLTPVISGSYVEHEAIRCHLDPSWMRRHRHGDMAFSWSEALLAITVVYFVIVTIVYGSLNIFHHLINKHNTLFKWQHGTIGAGEHVHMLMLKEVHASYLSFFHFAVAVLRDVDGRSACWWLPWWRAPDFSLLLVLCFVL